MTLDDFDKITDFSIREYDQSISNARVEADKCRSISNKFKIIENWLMWSSITSIGGAITLIGLGSYLPALAFIGTTVVSTLLGYNCKGRAKTMISLANKWDETQGEYLELIGGAQILYFITGKMRELQENEDAGFEPPDFT